MIVGIKIWIVGRLDLSLILGSPDNLLVDGCCEDRSDDQREDEHDGSAGRIRPAGDFILNFIG